MENRLLFMAGDYEAIRFCSLHSYDLQCYLNRHFAYSCLITDEVILPVGCYYESAYVQNLVENYRMLFFPSKNKRAIAYLGLGADRASYKEDAEIKASWFPEESIYQDHNATVALTKNIIDIIPYSRSGSMRKKLTQSILRDVNWRGESYNAIKRETDADHPSKRAQQIVAPLIEMVNTQQFALLPPYIHIEMKKQNTENDREQENWLCFILFKNYVLSCEKAYDAYCNNPLSIFYQSVYRHIYTYELDYRDTLLFQKFTEIFPFRELRNIEQMSPTELLAMKTDGRFTYYLSCYKTIVHRIKENLRYFDIDPEYVFFQKLIETERKKEQTDLRSSLLKNTLDAETLYHVLGDVFHQQSKQKFCAWLENRPGEAYPILRLLTAIDDPKDGVFARYIDEMWQISKVVSNKERRKMKKKQVVSLFTKINHFNLGDSIHYSPDGETKSSKFQAPSLSEKNKDSSSEGEVMPEQRRFAIALSFASEDRQFVEETANILSIKFGKDRILYDRYHQAEFAKPNLDIYLQKLYSQDSDLIVMFPCTAYNEKVWCGIEARAIRTLINDRHTADRIMFIKCSAGIIDGVFGTIDGYIDVVRDQLTPQNVAELILQRYSQQF